MHPDVILASLAREKVRYPNKADEIDKQIAVVKAQPRPIERTDTGSQPVADRKEVILKSLRKEKARYPEKSDVIDSEIARLEGTTAPVGLIIERAVTVPPKGKQKAVTSTDLEG